MIEPVENDSSAVRREIERIRDLLKNREPMALNIPDFRPAAVLVPMQFIGRDAHLVFTERSGSVEHHKNQVSFPGGALDSGEGALACALRETSEEIGVRPEDVTVLGRLDEIFTITSFTVAPFVGVIPHPYDFVANEREIDEVFTVPIRHLLRPEIFSVEMREAPWGDFPIYYYRAGPHTIWGATARILTQFLQLAYGKRVEP